MTTTLNATTRNSDADGIRLAALTWYVEREKVCNEPSLWLQFEEWMARDPRHRQAYLELEKLGLQVKALPSPLQSAVRSSSLFSRESRDWRPSMVASIALAVILVLAAGFWMVRELQWTTYETALGQRKTVSLPDGSTLEMNTASLLKVRIDSAERNVLVVRGESLFHVAHDDRRPFVVSVGGTSVRDVGTAFSVRLREPSSVEVLVEYGRVQVSPVDDMPKGGGETDFSSRHIELAEGEGVLIPARGWEGPGPSVKPLGKAVISRRLAWTSGNLDLYGQTLQEAVLEFNRYNRIQIAIDDPKIGGLSVGGTFGVNDPEAFASAVAQAWNLRVSSRNQDGSTLVLTQGRP
jgi:transmembrane sensor